MGPHRGRQLLSAHTYSCRLCSTADVIASQRRMHEASADAWNSCSNTSVMYMISDGLQFHTGYEGPFSCVYFVTLEVNQINISKEEKTVDHQNPHLANDTRERCASRHPRWLVPGTHRVSNLSRHAHDTDGDFLITTHMNHKHSLLTSLDDALEPLQYQSSAGAARHPAVNVK